MKNIESLRKAAAEHIANAEEYRHAYVAELRKKHEAQIAEFKKIFNRDLIIDALHGMAPSVYGDTYSWVYYLVAPSDLVVMPFWKECVNDLVADLLKEGFDEVEYGESGDAYMPKGYYIYFSLKIEPEKKPYVVEETMDIRTEPGSKVVFLDKGGYQIELENARKYMKKGDIFTVEYIEVGDWTSSVRFEEIPAKAFNTVLFGNVKE